MAQLIELVVRVRSPDEEMVVPSRDQEKSNGPGRGRASKGSTNSEEDPSIKVYSGSN